MYSSLSIYMNLLIPKNNGSDRGICTDIRYASESIPIIRLMPRAALTI